MLYADDMRELRQLLEIVLGRDGHKVDAVADVAAGKGGPAGVGIAAVVGAGPAARSGLHAGDVVTAVNGQAVDTARGLIRAVAVTAPGATVKLTVHRQGRDLNVSVTVGRRPKIEEN